ncbi:hypothetical protein CYY_007228 [Polysphondylium violaceum]|uniref:PUM-HD domain-containing protein n=1 Tax=Polysphondylium violaceum TaxID=133409 RepID=A0A8J4PPW6_9MYCE|nr:hypothetical protein CYY_007228 [Polysphondylium violaceum]
MVDQKKSTTTATKKAPAKTTTGKPSGKPASTGAPLKTGSIRDKKKTKKDKREEKIEKKSKFDTNYPMVREAKLLWVKIKEIKLSKEDRSVLVEELSNKLKGHILEIVLKHEASRIVQSLLKYGTEEQKLNIFTELKGHEMVISKNQYGRFLILKLLKYGNEAQRNTIIKSFYGKYVQLVSHKESSSVVEYIFAEVATPVQKTAIIEEFYGPEYRLFKSEVPRTLEDIIAASPNKKESILAFLSKTLTKMISSKGDRLTSLTLIQHLLVIFFKHSSPEECVDMADTLSELLTPMVHTKEGAIVSYFTISYGSPKVRKAIVKSFKEFFSKIALQEYGHLAIVRLLDVVDDTLLLTKSVLNELIPILPESAVHKQGYLWIMHILAPYTLQNFSETTVGLLSPTMKSSHGVEAQISKKDRSQRRKEILDYISPKLLELCSSHTLDLLNSPWGCRVLYHTLSQVEGNKIILIKKILENITEELLIEQHANIQMLLKNEYIKSIDLPVQLLEKFNWMELVVKDSNIVFILRELLKALPESDKKSAIIKQIQASKTKLKATKFPGIDTLFNLNDNSSTETVVEPTPEPAKVVKKSTTKTAAATKATTAAKSKK